MQIRNTHRALAMLLALVMVVGLLPATVFARSTGDDGSAEINEAYAAHESLMPVGPSFNVNTLLEWTPETDPDAVYSRASIELKPQDRVTGFVVNPQVNPEAKLMLCSLANSAHDSTSAQGTESFLSWSFNYWQYTNSFVYWSGSEEGLICCPTGEFVDAAHTNGVPVVATLGFPWGGGTTSLGQNYVDQVKDFVQKNDDGTFPVADKLIQVMKYYGFDGYFFNQESYGCSATEGALIDEMMRYMHKKCPEMLISWYDSMLPTGSVSYQNAVTPYNQQFMTDSEDGTRAIDEFMMNYNWFDGQINTTISTMKSIGRNQFDAFAGIDVQQNCMDTDFRDYLLVDEDGMTRLSLALYCPNSTLGLSTSGENFHEVERTFYTNGKADPRDTSVDLSTNAWAGMSRFFADRTVITGAPFVTNFNSGHGHAYYVDGVKSRTSDWSYQSNQDVMPTWTWIIDSEGSKLAGGYDFTDAYNGGTSVKFSGSLSAGKANDIMLYSTKVAITDGMTLGLTYKGDKGLMKLVAYTGDESTKSYEACTKTELTLTQGADGAWTTTNADLSALAGKTLYAVGLKIESAVDVENYQVNLGRLTILDKSRPTLNGPAKVTLDEILYTDAYTAEARIFWNKVSGASSYEIYKVNADGSRTLIMETPNTAYYIPALKRDAAETDVTLEIIPLNRNGERGKGTQLVIDWAYGNGDSEEIVTKSFENFCLNAEVTGVSFENSGEPASKALDGTAANNSKWCATNKSTGWMSIDIGREVTVRRWRVEHAEYGGEAHNMNTIEFALEYKNAAGEWVEVKHISDNTDAVTDILLDEPVTAQEWKLAVYNDGSSPWGGIRIYEWQMFEKAEFPATTPISMHFASAFNGVGEADTFTLRNVPALQTVKVYTKDGDTFTKIGEATNEATVGTVTLENLDFGTAEAGRIYYTTTAPAAEESAKLSAPFEAENATKSEPATEIAAEKYSHAGSTTSSNGDDIYVTLTVRGLQPGDVIYVYENGASAGYTKASLPVAEGATSVSLRDVRVTRAGGELPMQVKRAGKLISDIYTVTTQKFAEPTATIHLTARNSLGEALTGVHYDVLNESGEKVSEIGTTSDSGGKVELELGTYTLQCASVPAGYSRTKETIVKRLTTESETYEVEVLIPDYVDPAITALTITPAQPVIALGKSAKLSVTFEGIGDYPEGIDWTLTGNTAEGTKIAADGTVTVAADEEAKLLTVTATSTFDATRSATVKVMVATPVNVAKGAEIWAYPGSGEGTENGPEKMVDGDVSTVWTDSSASWVAIDLGEYKEIDSITVHHAGAAGLDAAQNTVEYSLFWMDPDSQYYTYWDFGKDYRNRNFTTYCNAFLSGNDYAWWAYLTTVTANTANSNTIVFDEPLNARYLMILVKTGSSSDSSAVCIAEMEVNALAVDMDAIVKEAQDELQAYHDALLAKEQYSAEGKEKLAQLLENGKSFVSKCETIDDLNAAVETVKTALDAVPTLAEELEEAVKAAEAAAKAAEEAQKAAEAAQEAAEKAKKDAEEAASSTAADKTAAEEAQKKAEEAQKLAEEAREAAKTAQKAAEDAAKAAEASNVAAAQQAAEAAKQAAAAATKANEAAASAAAATEAMQKAQAAQAAAEKARDAANDAQKKAEEAQKKAEEAAASAAEDKTAAEKAKAEAEAAKEAAKAAEEAAKQSEEAAKLARDAAEASNKEAAASAALAAEYAQKVAEQYQEIVKMKLEMVEMLAKTQQAAADAEAERKAAEAAALASAKYYALFNLSEYAKTIDVDALNEHQKAVYEAAIAAANEAVEKATTVEEVNKAVEAAKAAIDAVLSACPAASYTDVDLDAWYHEAVDYMLSKGYMNGVGGNRFDVDGSLTRAQLVTILYRVAGTSEVKDAKNPFTDVKMGEWYSDAILWAAENGIVKGMSETAFAPDGKITREQIATILYRYAKAEAVKEDKLGAFPDADKISDYAKDAMNWAVAEGIINGSDGKLLPQDFATRAQISAILMRYLEK